MKKIFSRIVAAILAVGLIIGCQKNPSDFDQINPEGFVSKNGKAHNYMVITKGETVPDGFESKISSYGKIIKSIPEIGVVVVKPLVTGFESKVLKLAEVQTIVPDLVTKWLEPVKFFNEANPPSMGDDEPHFWRLWGMDAINAPEAWNAGFTGTNVRVFILDSGIDAEHPDLAANLNTSLCASFVPGEDYNVEDGFYFNHGTHVAGIVAAANNSLGIIGVAPEAEIVAVKVLSEYSGSGAFSWINAGIVYAANNGAQVINMSLGATLNKNGWYYDEVEGWQKIPASYVRDLILAQQRAVNYAYKKGVIIISSAGNDALNLDGNGSQIKIPAELQNVMSVSATAPDYWYGQLLAGTPDPNLDIPSSYSNIGKSAVDVAAPGGDFDFYDLPNWHWDMVLSTIPGGYSWAAGTSMASPHVAGVAALIIARHNGNISPDAVSQQILKTADKVLGNGNNIYIGKGRVNAYRAVTE